MVFSRGVRRAGGLLRAIGRLRADRCRQRLSTGWRPDRDPRRQLGHPSRRRLDRPPACRRANPTRGRLYDLRGHLRRS